MSGDFSIRPARKSDASEIALLVNIAVHGGMARRWAADDEAAGTYDPIEVGRLEMMKDESDWGWRCAIMAEADGEVTGMILGYRKPNAFEPVPASVSGFMRPIEELEAEAAGMWFISMLGVHRNWRGRGVGTRLLGEAEFRRVTTAAKGLALIVEDSNDGARNLYVRHGLAVRDQRPMGQSPGGAAAGGNWLLMVKD